MTIECVVHGRYVIVYNERKDGVDYPDYYFAKVFNELCEVEVYGEYVIIFLIMKYINDTNYE